MCPVRKPAKTRPAIHNGRDNRIIIRGARVHNLKNLNLDLPRNKLIVMTGVSGSGKSSLAFDTIYAEGQRRYVESLSSYARQFLERMDKPDVDLIQGISPAMAIEQKTNVRNPRSTVGTSTEVYDYLRLLFARLGKTHCSQCGSLVTRDSVQTVHEVLLAEAAGESGLKAFIMFPLVPHPKESLSQALESLKKEGFFRVVIRGEIYDINEQQIPPKAGVTDVHVLVDRVIVKRGDENVRLTDSIETAFASGGGKASVYLPDGRKTIDFNQRFVCSKCDIPYEEPDPRLFSFNNPFGACPECQGFGRAVGIDMNLVIPDRARSIRNGAIAPWSTPKFRQWNVHMVKHGPAAGVRVDVPYRDLTDNEKRIVLSGGEGFEGILAFFKMVEKKGYKIFYRVLLSRYRGYTVCQSCNGSRLRREALNVRVGGKTVADVVNMTIADAGAFIKSLKLDTTEAQIGKRILQELRKRLQYLNDVGIGYLALDRLSNTLSGGESQRINLATSLGSSLVGALYVLDEPSIGLHPRDNEQLIHILKSLRNAGNTVLVVEHDADMMMESDLLVDLGPYAGENGGTVVYVGSPADARKSEESLTGKYLSGRLKIPVPSSRRSANGRNIVVEQASHHNLKDVTVDIPLNMFVCITGVSGSGKSTLVHDVLFAGLRAMKGDPGTTPGAHAAIRGHEYISAVELVDQSPIGRSPRSNPITYIQVFDAIRNVFASTQAAKVHGYKPGHFSFNVPGGRCESCEGDGVVKVEMQFLADLYLRCDACKGRRYREEVLQVRYRGKNIDDILSMTVSDAMRFFGADAAGRKITQRLKVLEDVGLGYIRLGQPATSLSGGEAQRVKLAAHLAEAGRDKHTLFIFDEPTTGLHFDDIAKLLSCFNALVEAGNSVLIIEHNMDVIKCADHVIDMGPEAGNHGGEIVAHGTPEHVATHPTSYTGRFLRQVLPKSS